MTTRSANITEWREARKINPIHVPSRYEAYLQTERFDRIRQAVLKRDNYKCVVCGRTETLQVHHLTYRNLYHEPTGDLITLCRPCHSVYHAIDKRREAVDAVYQNQINQQREYYEKQLEEAKAENEKIERESDAIEKELKREYLPKDYCKNGDLDMLSWTVLNRAIEKKCEEHGIAYWRGDKSQLRSFFLYRRCELLLRCMDRGYSLDKMINHTKFSPQWLSKWYRRDKCEAKLNEEKELFKEV